MENNELDGLIVNQEVFADKYNKMQSLLLDARYLFTAPHRTEEVDRWLDDLKQVLSNK